MSSERRGALQKIEVTCKTCDVTESFYSEMSVQGFKARHLGHDIVMRGGGSLTPRPVEPKPAEETTPAPAEAEPLAVAAPEQPLEKDWGTKLTKILVDVVVFPALRDSVFRVRGFKDDVEEAFVATSRFENGEMVKRMLESGEYTDFQAGGTRYVWQASAIEFEGDAREMLGMGTEPVSQERAPEPEPAAPETPQIPDDSVARTNELLFEEPSRPENAPATVDSVFPSSPMPPTIEGVGEPPAKVHAVQSRMTVERPSTIQEPAPGREVEGKAEPAVEEKAPVAALRAVEEEQYLLVSKSWYIQGGEKNKKEAARISMVLKDFRWRVEPLYTIGVILDDILSIETNKGQISRALIRSIENAGYRLTAVTSEQGKPAAWFKKVGEATATKSQEASADGSVLEKDEPEFEPDVEG